MLPIPSFNIMMKLPPGIAAQVWSSPHTDHRRAASLLHLTIWHLEWQDLPPPAFVSELRRMLDGVRVHAFDLIFNRIIKRGDHTELVSDRRLAEAKTLRRTLVELLIDDFGLPLIRPGKLRPHITMSYRRPPAHRSLPVGPLSWRATEFLLVESVIGETRHVEHGRWQLHERG